MSDTVKLVKGQNVELSKVAPGMTKAIVGLGWDELQGSETADLDAMAFLLKTDGKVRSDKDFVYYNNLDGAAPAVKHSGDDLTGGSSEHGDDEQIQVDLSAIPSDVESIKFLVDIYQAAEKGQNFGQVKNAYVRLVDAATNQEVVRYDLTEDYSGNTDVMVAELYRHDGTWKFKAIGEGSTKGSSQIAKDLGVNT
jgi:tellurium resistance protein TerD